MSTSHQYMNTGWRAEKKKKKKNEEVEEEKQMMMKKKKKKKRINDQTSVCVLMHSITWASQILMIKPWRLNASYRNTHRRPWFQDGNATVYTAAKQSRSQTSQWYSDTCLLSLLLNVPFHTLVYFRDGSAQTSLRAATLRQKLQIKAFYLTQSQYTNTGPTSPRADPITPGTWQGSHWNANV